MCVIKARRMGVCEMTVKHTRLVVQSSNTVLCVSHTPMRSCYNIDGLVEYCGNSIAFAMGHVSLVAITGAYILVPYLEVKSRQHIWRSGERFKNTYALLNLGALEISTLYKNCIFQCMGKICCVEFQRFPLKVHTKYLTRTLKDVHFIYMLKFKST